MTADPLTLRPSFEACQGQCGQDTLRFTAKAGAYQLHLHDTKIAFQLPQPRGTIREVQFSPAGNGRLGAPIASDKLITQSSYFFGRSTIAGVPHYGRIRYREVWPGIDIEFRISGEKVEYDLYLAPGADPALAKFLINGADSTRSSNDGVVRIRAGEAELIQRAPVVFQEVDGHRREIRAAATVAGNVLSFTVGDYSRDHALIIDPVLEASTMLGTLEANQKNVIGVHPDGSIYVAGVVKQGGFAPLPVAPSGYRTARYGGEDVFIARIAADMKTALFFTYFGGTGDDAVRALAVDSAGNPVIAGGTNSYDFPTTAGAVQRFLKAPGNPLVPKPDAFITKFNAQGTAMIFSTLLGGEGADSAQAVTLDASGNIFAAGSTAEFPFPTSTGAYRTAPIGGGDAWVAKLTTDASAILFSTYFGGTGRDAVAGLGVDGAGSAYIGGETESKDIPISSGAVVGSVIDDRNGYVAKFTPDGQSLAYSTYLGASSIDYVTDLKVDSAGFAYATGATWGTLPPFPTTPGAYMAGQLYGTQAFLVKLNLSGTAFEYSTVIGALGANVEGRTISLAGDGRIWIGGSNRWNDFPSIGPPVSPRPNGYGFDIINGFLALFSAAGHPTETALLTGRKIIPGYPFGYAITHVTAIAPAGPGKLAVSGVTDSTFFPVSHGAMGPVPPANFNWNTFLSRVSTTGCDYSVSQTAVSFSNLADSVTINVGATPGCQWAPSATETWLGAEALSDTQLKISVPYSTEVSRSGKVIVGGLAIDIVQGAGCNYAFAPSTIEMTAAGGNAYTKMVTATTCPYTLISNADWLKVRIPDRYGPADLDFGVDVHYGSAPRSAKISIASGESATINQAGNSCSYTLSPANLTFSFSPGGTSTGAVKTVQVATQANCPWTVRSSLNWVAFYHGGVGSTEYGPGYIEVQPGYNQGAARTGTVEIAGQTLSISQTANPSLGTLTIVSGNNQSAALGQQFGSPLLVRLLDSSNQPISGALVRYSGPSTGAGARFNGGVSLGFDAYTDVNGYATTDRPFANAVAGSYLVSVTVDQSSLTATFALTNGNGAFLTFPAAGVSVRLPNVTFVWTKVVSALDYWLDVGTSPGQGNLYAGSTANNSRYVTNLPCTGQTLYARLWTRKAAGYEAPIDSVFRAGTAEECNSTTRSVIVNPLGGSVLSSPSQQFTWSRALLAVSGYLEIGTTPGGDEIYHGNLTTIEPTFSIGGLPCNGAPVYLRLWTRDSVGFLPPIDYTYTAASNCFESRGNIVSPVNGSAVTGPNVTFTWSTGAGALDYWLDVGTAPGSGNLYGGIVAGLSKEAGNIPCDGKPLYARLWTRTAAGYSTPIDYSYSTANSCSSASGKITIPVPGSSLTAASVTFSWSAGSAAIDYWLDVGTAPASGNLFAGTTGGALSRTVGNIPCDGKPVYVRLWTKTAAGYLAPVDYNYVASSFCGDDTRGNIVSPANGSTLSGTTVDFQWTPGEGATDYWLDAGTAPAIGDVFGGIVAGTSKQVANVPCTNGKVYARLWTRANGVYLSPRDYIYNCGAADARAVLTSPAPGTRLPSTTVTFTWTNGSGASEYWLDVGNSQGSGDISAGASETRSRQVSGIPTGSGIVWVRLWTKIDGTWRAPIDYQFQRP